MKIRRHVLHIFLLLMPMLFGYELFGQDLSNLDEKDPIKITGSASANQVYYGQSGSQSGRDPYSYYLMGRLNVALYGWNIPLSYRYSNQSRSFQQPFNQFSLSPRYKWIQAHVGYSSMSFSNYTMSGHQFYGAGLELKPTNDIEVALMYGRLKRATEADTSHQNREPSFRRKAYGIQTTLKKWNGTYTFTLFRSKDEQSSLDSIPVQQGILPEENLVLSFKTSKTLFQNFSFDLEYAGTAITSDLRSRTNDVGVPVIYNNAGAIFTPRQSSSFHKALKTSMNYQFESASLALAYERVDPEYRTHGAYYFRNDLENITINGQSTFFEERINISMNAGLQRDDLNNQKTQQMKRLVSSVNAGFRASDRLNINVNYSNFQSYTHVKNQFEDINNTRPYNNLDTLDFTQISQNMGFSLSYKLKSTEKTRRQISLNGSWQEASSEQGDVPVNSGSKFYNLNASYNYSIQPIGLSLNTTVNMNQSRNAGKRSSIFGPNVSVNKSFFDRKLRSSFSTSYNRSYSGGEVNSEVFNIRFSNSFKWKEQHSLQMSMIYMNRKRPNVDVEGFSEFTIRMNYNYRFK